MCCEIINFIIENAKAEKSNKIIENIICIGEHNYFIKIQIINENDYKSNNVVQINHIFCDNGKNESYFLNEYKYDRSNIILNTFEDYDLLIDDINKKLNDTNNNDKINFGYRLNFFEDGFWYFIIDIVKKYNKNNEITNAILDSISKSDSDTDIKSDIFEDLFEWNLKEWIIELLEEKKEYEKEKDNYIKEIINLKKQIEKLENKKNKKNKKNKNKQN